jgi:four helix bundle protein
VQKFTELKVWQKSHALVLLVYRMTKNFPADERQAAAAELRRSALLVPTNIAEGSKRQINTEYARFLNIAEGHLAETEYLTIVSRDLRYLSDEGAKAILLETDEIAKMLHALRSKVIQPL